jgi:hypothetical protein
MLVKLCEGDTGKWPMFLPQAVFALNIRHHESTRISPFYLVFGIDPRLPGDELPVIPPFHYDTRDAIDSKFITSKRLAALGQHRAAALFRLQVQAQRMKQRYDKDPSVSHHRFQGGDVVKMHHHDKQKFQFAWTGPYYIVDEGFNDSYYLMKPGGQRLDAPVNHDYLAPFHLEDGECYYYAGIFKAIEQV